MKNKISLFRIVFTIILLILGIQPVQGVEVGVLFGPTFNRFTSPDLSWDYRISYSAGAYANIRLYRYFQLQPELRFAAARSHAVIPIIYYNSYRHEVNLSKTIQHIELPVILRFSPLTGGKIQPNLQLGLYAAFNIYGEDYLEFQGQSHTEDIKDELKWFHTGLLVGVGIDFRLFRIPIQLSGQWRISFTPTAVNYIQQEIKLTGFVISMGVGIWNPGGRTH